MCEITSRALSHGVESKPQQQTRNSKGQSFTRRLNPDFTELCNFACDCPALNPRIVLFCLRPTCACERIACMAEPEEGLSRLTDNAEFNQSVLEYIKKHSPAPGGHAHPEVASLMEEPSASTRSTFPIGRMRWLPRPSTARAAVGGCLGVVGVLLVLVAGAATGRFVSSTIVGAALLVESSPPSPPLPTLPPPNPPPVPRRRPPPPNPPLVPRRRPPPSNPPPQLSPPFSHPLGAKPCVLIPETDLDLRHLPDADTHGAVQHGKRFCYFFNWQPEHCSRAYLRSVVPGFPNRVNYCNYDEASGRCKQNQKIDNACPSVEEDKAAKAAAQKAAQKAAETVAAAQAAAQKAAHQAAADQARAAALEPQPE